MGENDPYLVYAVLPVTKTFISHNRSWNCHDNPENAEDDINAMFVSLRDDPRTLPLYEFITKCHHFSISIDLREKTINKDIAKKFNIQFSYTYGYTDNNFKRIYLGRCESTQHRYAAFAHEVFHAACFTIYKNEGLSYFKLDQYDTKTITESKRNQQKELESIRKNILDSVILKKSRNNIEFIEEEIIDLVFIKGSTLQYQKTEIVPRVPHLINLYCDSDPEKLKDLEKRYSDLFDYYQKYSLPQIIEYNKSKEESEF